MEVGKIKTLLLEYLVPLYLVPCTLYLVPANKSHESHIRLTPCHTVVSYRRYVSCTSYMYPKTGFSMTHPRDRTHNVTLREAFQSTFFNYLTRKTNNLTYRTEITRRESSRISRAASNQIFEFSMSSCIVSVIWGVNDTRKRWSPPKYSLESLQMDEVLQGAEWDREHHGIVSFQASAR